MQMVYNMREQEGNHINKYSCVSHTHHIHKRKFVLHSHVKNKFCSEISLPCGVPITFFLSPWELLFFSPLRMLLMNCWCAFTSFPHSSTWKTSSHGDCIFLLSRISKLWFFLSCYPHSSVFWITPYVCIVVILYHVRSA